MNKLVLSAGGGGMTRQEAIKELIYIRDNIGDTQHNFFEACDMAIEALEQDPCGDAISRADVLDLCDSKAPDYCVSYFKEDVECLQSVPSVAPIRPKGEWLQVDDDADAFDCSECGRMYSRKYNFCPNCGSHNGGY